MGLSIGSSSPSRDHGNRYYDVRDFGAVSRASFDAPTAAANALAFQKAYDTAAAQLTGLGFATVYVPAGNWFLSTPIFMDKNYVGFRGEGAGVSQLMIDSTHDIIVAGFPRKPNGLTPSPDHFPDAFTGGPGGSPVYDASAVTATGQKWGLRTKGDHHLSQQGGPLDMGLGDGYRNSRQLTISMYIDFSQAGITIPPGQGSATFPNSGAVGGMVNSNVGQPWFMIFSSGHLQFVFTTVDANGLNPVKRGQTIYTFPGSPGLIKIDIQIDLINAQVSAYVNGVQQGLSVGLGADFTPASNLYFSANDHLPFSLQSTDSSIAGSGSVIGGAVDLTYWGFKVSTALLFTNRNTAGTNDTAGAGTTQTRIDGQTLNDNLRYFSADYPNCTARLALTDSPAAVAGNRLVTVLSNVGKPSTAFFCDNSASGSPVYPVDGLKIEGLGLICGNVAYGRCVTVCIAYDLSINDCWMQGGNSCIGALNSNTNYPTYIDNCKFNATDNCIYLANAALVHIRRCSFQNSVAMMRFSYCNAWVEQCFVSSEAQYDYVIWASQTSLHVSHLGQDAEGPDGGPTKAMIYISGNSGGSVGAMGSTSRLEFISGGRQKTGSAIVVLEDGGVEDGNLNRPNRFSMVHCVVEDGYATTVVRNNGQRWRGTVVADIVPQRPQWIQNTDPSGQGNVVSEHDYFTGPPRDGTWGRNAHILKVTQPAASQYSQWRCLATGAYGTASPPTWFGLDPIDDGLSLAAYLQDNTFWNVSGMPAGGMGFWSNGSISLFLNALFGGSMPATPTPLYAAACCRLAMRGPNQTVEMAASNGYARTLAGTWTLAAAGATNAGAITFPTATANWVRGNYYNVVNSLAFYTAATGGNYVAVLDVPPVSILSGQILSYAAGALTVARAASPLGSFADSVHAQMNGFWLNHSTFTAPSIYLALSTSAASLSPPVEPSGGGYARVATSAASWARNAAATSNMMGAISTTGVITNATTLTFPAPAGGWGTVQSVYLMDAATGGNVLGSANLAIPRTILSGSPARSFATGALWICRS